MYDVKQHGKLVKHMYKQFKNICKTLGITPKTFKVHKHRSNKNNL